MVSLLGYGSSTTYVGALLSRALPALFVGSPVAMKSMMGDVCDQTGQAKAMAGENPAGCVRVGLGGGGWPGKAVG